MAGGKSKSALETKGSGSGSTGARDVATDVECEPGYVASQRGCQHRTFQVADDAGSPLNPVDVLARRVPLAQRPDTGGEFGLSESGGFPRFPNTLIDSVQLPLGRSYPLRSAWHLFLSIPASNLKT